MILKLSVIFISAIFVLGQNCKFSSKKSGYCREKDDCFGPSQAGGCKNGLICCQKSEKSDQKCRTYGAHVFRRSYNGALMARALVHNISECNIEATPLVVGGLKAKPKEFPHMVAIGYGRDLKNALWMCGGSLISENFVLSAAHCSQMNILQNEPGELHQGLIISVARGPARFARLGASNLKTLHESEYQDIVIKERINHPKYKPPSQYNDIALFKLSRSVQINGFVRPACLHTGSNEFKFKKGMATGWGKVDYDATEGSEDLLKVTISFIGYSECSPFFSPDTGGRSLQRGIITSQLCAGELKGGKDTCQGDSGGPLQIVNGDPYCTYSIVGVTSFGKFCGFENSPAVYTRVSYFVPWIESIVWP